MTGAEGDDIIIDRKNSDLKNGETDVRKRRKVWENASSHIRWI